MPVQRYDAGEEVEVKERKTKTQLKEEKEVEYMRQLLNTRFGRSILWRILSECGVTPMELSFTGNSTTFFKEGRRSIGNYIITEITKADKKAYPLMMLEQIDEDMNA